MSEQPKTVNLSIRFACETTAWKHCVRRARDLIGLVVSSIQSPVVERVSNRNRWTVEDRVWELLDE